MNKPLMGHGEEENPICIRCMHTQSLVGHMQVDNTVLQAGGNVDWRKKAVSFFAHSFQQVMLKKRVRDPTIPVDELPHIPV